SNPKVLAEYEKLFIKHNVGGVMLFNEYKKDWANVENQLVNEEYATSLIRKLKSYSKDLFVGVDVEGGSVDRLHQVRGGRYPSARLLGKLFQDMNDHLFISYFEEQGSYLKELGFNFNAAPVLDVVPSYDEKYLMAYSERSFSDDAETVSGIGRICIKSLQDCGIMPVAKHFPGLGPVLRDYDPHYSFPKIRSISEESMKPFREAINHGLDAVMTTHLKVSKYGKSIATTNKKIVSILRKKCFNGIIMTDDLCLMSTGMFGKTEGLNKKNLKNIVKTACQAFKAGHDIVLVRQLGLVNDDKTDIIRMIIDEVSKKVDQGVISEEQLRESYKKVLGLKRKYCT
ncbi:hypothetical protein FJZ53_04955, partial [Candidatus Woesearchaeota archaeon]|nr:hypothetical protein [Candidatus Woesearchaeota archaeon]